jgi:hypothetical protein
MHEPNIPQPAPPLSGLGQCIVLVGDLNHPAPYVDVKDEEILGLAAQPLRYITAFLGIEHCRTFA